MKVRISSGGAKNAVYHASQSWFVGTYKHRGIEFDRIFAWEATPYNDLDIFASMPSEVFDSMSYFNIPADPKIGSKFNPLRTLRDVCKPSDFVVLKIDIDHASVEEKLLRQITEDSYLASLIDELYFEHHVTMSPLMHTWQDFTGDVSKSANISHSYKLFVALRNAGIRAHSWV